MRFKLISVVLVGLFATRVVCSELSGTQEVLETNRYQRPDTGVGHFSEWSRLQKKHFWEDWQRDKASEWVLVMGNEGGDLDSITSALVWAYHLSHSTQNTSEPMKAVALLQTPSDQLDLRPENKLALSYAHMSSEHRDLLNVNELPEDVETLSEKLKGIVLVDHPKPLRRWSDANILSIFDHHTDVGAASDASPRVFEQVASCTTLVARQMLDELEQLDEEYHMPHELLKLVLSAIAIDSDALNPAKSNKTDKEVSKRIFARSHWAHRHLQEVMNELDEELGDAKKDLGALGLRDLLRRDWKASFVDTPSPRTPTVHLGFASIPISVDEQIKRTEWQELFNWFAVHAAWTAEASTDISVSMSKCKTTQPKIVGKKKKIREITLVVRDDIRVDDAQADELFKVAYDAIVNDEQLAVKPWHGADKLGKRQMVWTTECESCSRKYVAPLVEKAVKAWS
ncbi:hypothetical protein LTR78_004200 [Recurvomyces mirabilis]|uniref:Exopolyphosphatase n=1 Tax=Recurvomyces mirabilis TaxID=574656 RepID=A0AAE0WQW2_9PEZI|nr:hypothetical protein LTR78_004200 [Recurvomyces mirabilis]KAK5153630.1 hypothetical protein LTS14_007324 [Recurvomyces mirabilis]